MARDLPGCCLRGLDPALDDTEERLDRVEPRAVLGVEQDVHALGPCRLKHQTVTVDASIVQQEHHAGSIEGTAISEALEEFLKEVLEHRGIDSALDELRANNRVLGDTCDQTDGVVLRPRLAGGPDCECLRCKAVPAKSAGAPVAS
jgi:hypothetical protein